MQTASEARWSAEPGRARYTDTEPKATAAGPKNPSRDSQESALHMSGNVRSADQAILDDRIRREREVEAFIDRMKARATSAGFPPYVIAQRADTVWMDTQSEFGDSIPVPLLSLGPNGSILFSWETETVYLEIDLRLEGSFVYFEIEESEPESFPAFEGAELGTSRHALLAMVLSE